VYGDVVIRDQKVLDRLLDLAASRVLQGHQRGHDPWSRTTKTFAAVYAFGGKGPFRYISEREGRAYRGFRLLRGAEDLVGCHTAYGVMVMFAREFLGIT
jgi:hypothetical protein